MDKRRIMRRSRRGRIRNRQPRFDNRTRPESWLAPSLVTRLANTETWVRRLAALYPISLVRVETARFDTQFMAGCGSVRSRVPAGRPCRLAATVIYLSS